MEEWNQQGEDEES
jgi:hypothetical protein